MLPGGPGPNLDYLPIPGYDTDDTDALQRNEASVPLEALREERGKLDEQEQDVLRRIEDFNSLWESRRAPLDTELEGVRGRMVKVDAEITFAEQSLQEPDMPQPLGPSSLAWVEGKIFTGVSNVIVAMNLASMIFSESLERQGLTDIVDNVFLTWYILELGAKTAYHQKNLFFGKVSVVSWNWLDLMIVLGGILDQWLMSIVMASGGAGPEGASSPLGAIKFLRFLRVLRVLKFLRAILDGDARWTESTPFELFMSAVISANAVVMSLELDIEWSGWVIVENVFMVIYAFEWIMKLKLQGCRFFLNVETLIWNYLDMVLVIGGAMDLWLIPVVHLVQDFLGDPPDEGAKAAILRRVMSLLRLMRIMRMLRLVRLLKTIKPLYRLLLGVIESLKAMQWVMVLTMLMLYAGAIFWTSLVGKGLLYGGDPPPDGVKHFGTVATSLFSLFRIMNGDTSVVRSVTTTVFGQLMFAGFMVLSNWAILAILTSVVSDNMIAASQLAAEEDRQKEKQDEYSRRVGRLNVLFQEIDKDGSGCIDEGEWRDLCQDTTLFHELSVATARNEKDLKDMFQCMTASKAKIDETTGELQGSDTKIMNFEDLLEHLKNTADPADKRGVLQVIARLQFMERRLERQMKDLWDAFSEGQPDDAPTSQQLAKSCTTEGILMTSPSPCPTSQQLSKSCSREGMQLAAPPSSPLRKPKPATSPPGSPRVRKPSSTRGTTSVRRPAKLGGLRPQEGITKL